MEKTGWKVLAVACIIALIGTWGFIYFAYNLGVQEIDNEYECAYNICAESESYNYVENLCQCYDVNAFGQLDITKTEWISS